MRKKKLFLHIGTHKTGSTSIQHWLKENSHVLTANNFYYPMDGRYFYPPEASASLLAHAILGNQPEYIKNIKINYDACVSDIKRDVINSSCETIIISSEHFSHAISIDAIKNILNLFVDLFESISIIIYLRRQDTRLESSWTQDIKTFLHFKSFDQYFEDHFNADEWNYFDLLSNWSSVFGKHNIIVRPFEVNQFFNTDLISDFKNIINFSAKTDDTKLKNQSPPISLIEF